MKLYLQLFSCFITCLLLAGCLITTGDRDYVIYFQDQLGEPIVNEEIRMSTSKMFDLHLGIAKYEQTHHTDHEGKLEAKLMDGGLIFYEATRLGLRGHLEIIEKRVIDRSIGSVILSAESYSELVGFKNLEQEK